jgi:hypothetical protein
MARDTTLLMVSVLHEQQEECAGKNVEPTFVVLDAYWVIDHHSTRKYDKYQLCEVMFACVIMHNMIMEEEHDQPDNFEFDFMGPLVNLKHALV